MDFDVSEQGLVLYEEEENVGTHQQMHNSAGHELKHSNDDSSAAGKLFVGGIAWETTQESFRRYFSQFGEVTDSIIMMDKVSGRPRGFGFVTYADPEIADKVIEENHVIDGKAVEVKKTVPKEEIQVKGEQKTKKIFIGGLPISLTEDELREYFSCYGYVVEQQIMLDQNTGRSRGFGFVTFDCEEAVEKVLSNGRMHELCGKQVEIKRAEPKRSAFEPASESRLHRGGSSSKSYGGGFGGGYGGSVEGFAGGYGGKMGRGYGGYGGFEGYGGYGGYGKFAGAGAAGFYPGYGGYGYGFGFSGAMYGAAGYGGSGYGAPGYYGGSTGYANSKGYGGSGGGLNEGGKGGSGYGGYGTVGSGDGGNGGVNANENGGAANGRFHPYSK